MIIGRKRPDQMKQLETIQKQITIVERRKSEVKERRPSQLQLRVPEKIETSTV